MLLIYDTKCGQTDPYSERCWTVKCVCSPLTLSIIDEGEWDEVLFYALEWDSIKAVINLSCILSM